MTHYGTPPCAASYLARLLPTTLLLAALSTNPAPADGTPQTAPAAGDAVSLRYEPSSQSAAVTFKDPIYGTFAASSIRLIWPNETSPAKCTAAVQPDSLRLRYEQPADSAALSISIVGDGCKLSLEDVRGRPPWIIGRIGGSDNLLACRVAVQDGKLLPEIRDDIFEIGFGRASNRRMNAVYSAQSFWAVHFDAAAGATPDLRPADEGYTFRCAGPLSLRPLDLWPVIGLRRGAGVVPREWVREHRAFPWPEFSPVQLPYICMTDPRQWQLAAKQIDFLAENLRDYGFFCYGEWPVTQFYPEYDPQLQPAWLEAQRRICDYAHERGIKILRWLTDPEIDPAKYPDLHKMMEEKGWFAPKSTLLDYSNPDVQNWITGQYAKLAQTGPDFYWVDNCGPTPTVFDAKMTPLEGFRQFYAAIQKGLLSTGRNDILIRSGASDKADYSAAGILDVYAPGPDVANTWVEQAISVASQLVHEDYLCHYNLWRRAIDDYFPAGPQSIDQTRAMATLLAFTGLGFTTTDVGLPNIPPDRLELLRQVVPIGTMRPLDLYRFEIKGIEALQGWETQSPDGYKLDENPLPRIWTVSVQKGDFSWQLLAIFNWGLRTEQQHFISFADLGLDPDREYVVFDFFSQKPVGVFSGGIGCRVAPSSARSFAVHALGDRPFLVSTDRHITQGVVDTDALEWNPQSATLSGIFTAGVKGRTYQLTFYVPPGWNAAGAQVAGQDTRVTDVETGLLSLPRIPHAQGQLLRLPIACSGQRVNWSVKFERAASGPPASPPPPRDLHLPASSPVQVIDLRTPLADGSPPANPDDIITTAAGGAQVVLLVPPTVTADVRAVQDVLKVHWGTVRNVADEPASLTVRLPDVKSGADTFLQTTCVSYATNRVSAVYCPLERGGVLVVAPHARDANLTGWVERLASDPQNWAQELRARQAHRTAESFSTYRKWSVHFNVAEATIRFSPLLKGLELATYTAREGLWGDPVFIPHFDMTFNQHLTLQPLLDPCDPQSPPDFYDYMYRKLPAEAVWWGEDGENNELTHRYYAPARTENLTKLLPRNLTLQIETPGEIGTSDLASLPPVILWTPGDAPP